MRDRVNESSGLLSVTCMVVTIHYGPDYGLFTTVKLLASHYSGETLHIAYACIGLHSVQRYRRPKLSVVVTLVAVIYNHALLLCCYYICIVYVLSQHMHAFSFTLSLPPSQHPLILSFRATGDLCICLLQP